PIPAAANGPAASCLRNDLRLVAWFGTVSFLLAASDYISRHGCAELARVVGVNRYAALPLLMAASALGQSDWPGVCNDPGAMRYSTLRQIAAANVARLAPAWTFRTGKPGSEATPIVVDGVMYVTAPDGVYALVPETGDLLWKYDAAPVALRGLAYWKGTAGLHSRVFAGNGHFLLALDVTTGK